MISNEKHEQFLLTLDGKFKDPSDFDLTQIESLVNEYNELRYGHTLPIQWVKNGNTPIKEFYPSSLTISWLMTFIVYYEDFLSTIKYNKETSDIYLACFYMFIILSKIKGINTVNGVTYLLENDCEFVQYSMNRKPFI